MKSILVVRFSSLGDIVLTTGIIKYIKSNIKEDVEIDFLTSSHFAGILQDFPYIRNVYTINKGDNLLKLNEVISKMPEYNMVFDLHKNIRSLFTRFVTSGKSYVYNKHSFARREYVRHRLFQSKLKEHTVVKYFKPFMKAFKLSMPSMEELRPYLLNQFEKTAAKRKRIVIHPFASKNTKVWPFFTELARVLLDDGHDVLFIGDGEINVPVNAVNKTGKISFAALTQFIAQGDILITTDSGPMHIGTALNIPTLAVFGPTTKELGFYPEFNNTKVIEYIGLKCRPCHIHGSNKCPKKHFKCMMDIGVEEVRFHVNKMISENK